MFKQMGKSRMRKQNQANPLTFFLDKTLSFECEVGKSHLDFIYA